MALGRRRDRSVEVAEAVNKEQGSARMMMVDDVGDDDNDGNDFGDGPMQQQQQKKDTIRGTITTSSNQGRQSTPPSMRTHNNLHFRRKLGGMVFLLALVLSALSISVVSADDNYNADDYYQADDDDNVNYRDDDYYLRNQQYYVNDDNAGDDDGGDDGYKKEQQQYQSHDDDTFKWDENVGFDGVSVMPVSCVNYNNGHMIKFQLFDSSNSYQCRFNEIATFVVSIAHYMRAYFNYEALSMGQDFALPEDAAFLNCIQIGGTGYNGMQLYAKIGCVERETFTSTKLQLHVYTDAQCSQAYDDGQTARQHATRGYLMAEGSLDSRVSFRPPFYSCLTCSPDEVSETFNKFSGTWYDDDYISEHGQKQGQGDDGNEEEEEEDEEQGDDAAVQGDDYYRDDYFDDKYMAANDDVNYLDDDAARYRERNLISASPEDLKSYEKQFWKEYHEMMQQKKQREQNRLLYDNNYDVGDWNMCQRIYKYGLWCDEECRALDFFRSNEWSGADIFLLVLMCVFLTAMMLLVVAKRLKAQQKARMYGEDLPMPGLPPFAMAIIFVVIMAAIIALAKLKFVNETLVFAVVTCILLFIYMLKLTLFENRRPVLLAAPKHDMFDNPLDDHLFD